MSLFESIVSVVTHNKTPLHVGEVMTLWTGMVSLEEGRVLILGLMNHTADPELKRWMEHYLSGPDAVLKEKVYRMMQDEGIPLPPVTPNKVKANEADIPPGAKFTDEEIANMLVLKMVSAVQIIQLGIVQCLRLDLGTLLLEAHALVMKEAFTLRELMRRRGWLRIPPYWYASHKGD